MKLTHRIIAALTLVFGVMMAFTATAFASTVVVPPDQSLLDMAKPVYEQVMAGHYIPAAALALILLVALLKRYAPGKAGAFMHSDVGGVLTTFATSLGGAVALATVGGAAWHWSMLWVSAGVAVAAAGGYTMIKKLVVEPLMRSTWYQTKAPSWLKAVMGLALWMFDKPDSVAVAVKAGDAAVVAAPAGGADAVTGKATEV